MKVARQKNGLPTLQFEPDEATKRIQAHDKNKQLQHVIEFSVYQCAFVLPQLYDLEIKEKSSFWLKYSVRSFLGSSPYNPIGSLNGLTSNIVFLISPTERHSLSYQARIC